ncbi:MAG: glycosyltransferase family 39 protein [Candidatus Thermoplasmatota archaeon]|nr:glycosyltransferase family 39 protein [Candidatus Thermoplasmatota archaeon]
MALSLAEAREVPAGSFLSRFRRGDRGPSELRKWFVANWTTLFILALLFAVALFVRTYFGYDTAMDGYLVSGGSDSYYWQRIIDYSAETGKQLYWDPLINYPDGIRNPRPPFYSMSIVVPAVFAQGMFESLDDAIGWSLLWSTAFWGALTIIPTYFVGKETFGRRAGLAAAFFLAVMPAHVQRSVFSDADHDSFILFFIVLTFYFLLRAVKTQEHKRWVENWRSWSSIRAGLGDYVRESRTPMLYALMAGVAYGCVMIAWVGFGYVTVLILAYYLIQILLNKFKGFDSTSVTIIVSLAMAFGYLLAFPVYYEQSLIPVRFDVPVYLFVFAVVFGMLFVISRDYPWTLTLPATFLLLGAGIVIINAIDPSLAEAILSGQGYFVKSKLYSTIAEARAPDFSELAMSFGMVTFFLSLTGLIWAIIKIPKKATAEYIFIVVWLGAAIFMAISAGRFMFNAAPAFALAAAWVVVIIVDNLDFNSVRKSLMGASGSYWQIFRKSVKIRHIVGVLFIAFMVILPNVWYGTDAGIPSETKALLDKEIYESMPSFMRPDDYDRINGSNWYLGAFGYSIPLERYYFPSAWEWFTEYDSHIPAAVDRPAYVSWWDYGFEAVQAGQHPTVADNFQNGYQIAGNIIMAQSEAEVIALFSYRLLEVAMRDAETRDALQGMCERYGVDYERIYEIVFGPVQPIIDEVLEDPAVYGPMDSDLSGANAKIVAARVELVKLDQDALVGFYGELCSLTGWDIRYFSVDSRMFPRSGTDTGIFYAPAKLSDRRIDQGSVPIDFYGINAVDQYGREVALDQVTADMVIVDYSLTYKPMFYNSTFYRAMCGPSGYELGMSNDGIPSLSGTLQSLEVMPGWNMAHFRMVYRTAYYNPYPIAEIPYHRDAWTAISLEEAQELQTKIQNNEIQGYVDDSASSFYSAGVVFLKYYKGAYVNGTVTTEEGYPVANVRATVQDEYGIPHMSVLTDSEGRYSLLAPFGEITLVLSMGDTVTSSLVSSNIIDRLEFNVTDDQAMRLPYDLDGDGMYDYMITKDYQMRETQVTADLFWDIDEEGNYTAETDELIQDATVYAMDLVTGSMFEIDAPEGTFDTTLPPGTYDMWARIYGVNVTVSTNLTVAAGQKSTQKLALKPSMLYGYLSYLDGESAIGIELVMTELSRGYRVSALTDDEGAFRFEKLLSGDYSLTTTEPGYTLSAVTLTITAGSDIFNNLTIFPEATIRARVLMDGAGVPYAAYMLSDIYSPGTVVSGLTDASGRIEVKVLKGVWTLYAVQTVGSESYAGAKTLDLRTADSVSTAVSLGQASSVSGGVRNPLGATIRSGHVVFESSEGVRIPARIDTLGVYKMTLPYGTYEVTSYSTTGSCLFSGTTVVTGAATSYQVEMIEGVLVEGAIWLDRDSTGTLSAQELGRYAKLRLTDESGALFTAAAAEDGNFTLVYPKAADGTLSVGEAGFSEWSVTSRFVNDTTNIGAVVGPDEVVVQGRIAYDGQGLRGIRVTFTPQVLLLDVVTAVTSSGGYYTASLLPAVYTVSVDQDTNPMGGERYICEEEFTLLPSGVPVQYSLTPDKKVEMHGVLFGAESDMELSLSGPETRALTLGGTISYSAYLLPGEYNVYAKGYLGADVYANVTSVTLSVDSRQHDFQLYPAHELRGSIDIDGRPVTKEVTIRAVSALGEAVETTTSLSSYSIELPQGLYTVNFSMEDTKTEGGRTLYVEYEAEAPILISTDDQRLNPSLSRRLDNTTFSGTVYGTGGAPVRAYLRMVPNTVFGLGLEFWTDTSGSFNVSMQPGDYTVHILRSQDKSAYLGTLRLERDVSMEQSFNLTSGLYISGRVFVADAGASVDVSVATGSAKLQVTSDASGDFRVLVTEGSYILSATTTRVENDLTVRYTGSLDVNVEDTDSYVTLNLLRSSTRTVSVSWDRNLTQTVPPGVLVKYAFTVTNTGNIEDKWSVSSSTTGFNISFTPSTFELGLGSESTATVVAEITAHDDVAAGEALISAVVRSSAQSSARATVNLYLNVSPVHDVRVFSLNESTYVTGWSTITKFTVNNTGNIEDTFLVSVSNLDSLLSLGWSATIIDPATGDEVTEVQVDAFDGMELAVNFTATRSTPDVTASALVFAASAEQPASGSYGAVQVRLPDLVIGPGYVDAERADISYEYDVSRVLLNISLAIALVALVVMFFVLRKRKGLGKGGAAK